MKQIAYIFILFLFIGCANKTIIVQEKIIETKSGNFYQAVDSTISKFKYYIKPNNDSIFSLFKPPSNPWDKGISLKVLTRVSSDQVEIISKGVKLNRNGFIAENGNDYAFMFNSAVEQEIAFQKGLRLYDKTLPKKTWGKFLTLTMINPGLGVYYGYNTPMSKDLATLGGVFFGALDIGYIALLFAPDSKDKKGVSNKTVGILGIATFRLLMTMAFAIDMKAYRELQELPYYFDYSQMNKKIEVGYKYSF